MGTGQGACHFFDPLFGRRAKVHIATFRLSLYFPLLKFRIGDKSFLLKASNTFLEGWSLEKGFTNKLACSSLPGVLGVFCQSFSQESTGKGEAQDHRCALHRELRPGGCSGGVRHSLFAWRRWLGAWHCTGCSVV